MHNFPIKLAIALGGDLVRSTEHLGVAYIAAVLRKSGYSCSICEIGENDNIDYFIQVLKNEKIKLLGFTTTCINIKRIMEITSHIKRSIPEITVVYGGHMATFSSLKILYEDPYVDVIIRGEGEETFLELVNKLVMQESYSEIKGISYRTAENHTIIENENRELISDLDTLPFPVRDQFEQSDEKLQYIRLCTSRGCYGNCAFCSNYVGRNHKGPRWRGRSPKNVVNEIEYLVKTYDFHTYDFVDSTFEDPPNAEGKERIRKIAEEIIERDLEVYYNCCFRAENWSEKDHDLLDLLVKSGLEKINIGFESGNNKNLKILNKNATVEDNYRALEVIKKHPEIYVTFGFIFYHPYVTFEDLRDNATFLYKSGIGQVTRHYFWPLEVYPDTLIKTKLIDSGLLSDGKVVDDIYSYKFLYSEVGKFAIHMTRFLEYRVVWDFEIFDIVVHTYITRLLRKYEGIVEVEEIVKNFLDYVNTVRAEIAERNYLFVMNWIGVAENGWNKEDVLKAESDDLFTFIETKIIEIKSKQLKVSRQLNTMGYKLVGR